MHRWVVQVVVSLAWHGEWRNTLLTSYPHKIEKPLSRSLEMYCHLPTRQLNILHFISAKNYQYLFRHLPTFLPYLPHLVWQNIEKRPPAERVTSRCCCKAFYTRRKKQKGQTSRNVARYAYEQGYSRPWGKKYQVQVPPTCTCLPIFSNFAYRIQVTSCEALSSTATYR